MPKLTSPKESDDGGNKKKKTLDFKTFLFVA